MASEDNSQIVTGSRCAKDVKRRPLVKWVRSKTLDVYDRIKNSNETVNSVFNVVECKLEVVTKTASPLVPKLRSPLNIVDGYKSSTLCWMKNKLSSINESPQKVEYLLKSVDRLVKPFSKLGSLLMKAPEFLLNQISKLPSLPFRGLQSAENFVDNLFPMESLNVRPDNDSSSEASSPNTDVSLATSLLQAAESVGRLSFKLIRAGFLLSTAPFRRAYSFMSYQCVPPEFVADEVIIYSKNQPENSSATSSDQRSNLNYRNVPWSQHDD